MKKLMVLLYICLMGFRLQAQPRIDFLIKPTFDKPATIQLQLKDKRLLQLVFSQPGKPQKQVLTLFKALSDTSRVTHVRSLGVHFQQFELSDTVSVEVNQAPFLFKSFKQVYTQAGTLSKVKDERLKVDGLNCSIFIIKNAETQYEWTFGPPLYEDNKVIYQLLQAVIMALKMKSKNPATVNYCMIVDEYLND